MRDPCMPQAARRRRLFTLAVQARFQLEHADGVAAKALELNIVVCGAHVEVVRSIMFF